jgi:SAM-dependent methyltransferase
MTTDPSSFLTALRLSDSFLPVGGYTASYGLEQYINEDRIEEVRDRGYDAVAGDAQNFSLERDFDVIVAGEVIEHLSNPGGLFESSKSHLRPSGRLIITTPNPFALIRFILYYSPIHEFSVFDEHVSWFDRITLRQLAARYGYSEEDHYYPQADSFGLTQMFHRIGMEKLEDDFIGVYQIEG